MVGFADQFNKEAALRAAIEAGRLKADEDAANRPAPPDARPPLPGRPSNPEPPPPAPEAEPETERERQLRLVEAGRQEINILFTDCETQCRSISVLLGMRVVVLDQEDFNQRKQALIDRWNNGGQGILNNIQEGAALQQRVRDYFRQKNTEFGALIAQLEKQAHDKYNAMPGPSVSPPGGPRPPLAPVSPEQAVEQAKTAYALAKQNYDNFFKIKRHLTLTTSKDEVEKGLKEAEAELKRARAEYISRGNLLDQDFLRERNRQIEEKLEQRFAPKKGIRKLTSPLEKGVEWSRNLFKKMDNVVIKERKGFSGKSKASRILDKVLPKRFTLRTAVSLGLLGTGVGFGIAMGVGATTASIGLGRRLFSGLGAGYGSYDLATGVYEGKSRQKLEKLISAHMAKSKELHLIDLQRLLSQMVSEAYLNSQDLQKLQADDLYKKIEEEYILAVEKEVEEMRARGVDEDDIEAYLTETLTGIAQRQVKESLGDKRFARNLIKGGSFVVGSFIAGASRLLGHDHTPHAGGVTETGHGPGTQPDHHTGGGKANPPAGEAPPPASPPRVETPPPGQPPVEPPKPSVENSPANPPTVETPNPSNPPTPETNPSAPPLDKNPQAPPAPEQPAPGTKPPVQVEQPEASQPQAAEAPSPELAGQDFNVKIGARGIEGTVQDLVKTGKDNPVVMQWLENNYSVEGANNTPAALSHRFVVKWIEEQNINPDAEFHYTIGDGGPHDLNRVLHGATMHVGADGQLSIETDSVKFMRLLEHPAPSVPSTEIPEPQALTPSSHSPLLTDEVYQHSVADQFGQPTGHTQGFDLAHPRHFTGGHLENIAAPQDFAGRTIPQPLIRDVDTSNWPRSSGGRIIGERGGGGGGGGGPKPEQVAQPNTPRPPGEPRGGGRIKENITPEPNTKPEINQQPQPEPSKSGAPKAVIPEKSQQAFEEALKPENNLSKGLKMAFGTETYNDFMRQFLPGVTDRQLDFVQTRTLSEVVQACQDGAPDAKFIKTYKPLAEFIEFISEQNSYSQQDLANTSVKEFLLKTLRKEL